MARLTPEQSKQFKREGKVLLLSTAAYLVLLAPLSLLFSLSSVAPWGGPLFFGLMFLIDKKVK